MTPQTIARYAALQLPRYTSYPTAPSFSATVGEAACREWLGALPAETPLSLYLHIPFCRAMCWYCGCHTTVAAREAPMAAYLDALDAEIGLVAAALPARMRASHVHFGGGTPTLIRPHAFAALMRTLREHFALEPDTEIAVEIDPRTLSAQMSDALAAAGVNRASIGVQSFDPAVQRAINRVQSFECVASAVEGLRARGIGSINFDLIYGLPLQTRASCLETIRQVLRLRPDRLAVFGYAHVPAMKRHQRRIDEAALPGAAERWAQARAIACALVGAGYVEIGLDHFARPDDALARAARDGGLHRNFQGYTTDSAAALIGLGASSIGRLPQGFVQNAVPIGEYRQRVLDGRLPTARGYRFDGADRLRGKVIERLMCDHGVDLAELGAEELADEAALAPLVADGLVARRGSRLEIPADARPLVRVVAAAFDAHLAGTAARHARAV